MNILFYDVETTGKANLKRPPDEKGQPRVVQLGALLTDESGVELASLNCIVRPRQFDIPAEATHIHGITTEYATKVGVHIAFLVGVFHDLAAAADIHVAHNHDFDSFMMRGECARMVTDFPIRETFCTMKQMTDVCCLPGKYGWKWPSLMEAYRHCFQKDFAGAHNAMADVHACKEIYFWLLNYRRQQPVPQPKPA